MDWSPQHGRRSEQKNNRANLTPITFVNIKNARYQLPSSINSDHELNIKDIQFPTFRSRRMQKGKGNLVFKNN